MTSIYDHIKIASKAGEKLLAVLMDPDKFPVENTQSFIEKVNRSKITHVFVGGSFVADFKTDLLISEIKKFTTLPIVLFPGDTNQISQKADAILFLSLISGNNAEYLINKQVEAVPFLKNSNLEIIPTGYILVQNGKVTSVEKVTHTNPLSKLDVQKICDTAKAGEYLGMRLIYLEAGSGASHAINCEIVKLVKTELEIPLLVGGGIRSKKQINDAFSAGADLVVIGTILEGDESFFDELMR